MKEEDIFIHSEYVIVGYCKDNYIPTSLKVDCKPHEELLFELNIPAEQEVSVRFNQLFKGYLKKEEKVNYKYSPVLIELYKVHDS